ncbi:GGDEF domain-containing protein [Devosia oryziradicis]|uniref:diguanylate cyclase n=1 Tax=Devosia oryziradicis TaxID=2801335 RepID=A0ABX7C364_9HYPH|nr:tetratricopeptide repeat-containing diguanylate cyclase [Devosia oryziradicis]QQR37674.1 GGDEF domain-containing protein [Devosia oryziradicis]
MSPGVAVQRPDVPNFAHALNHTWHMGRTGRSAEALEQVHQLLEQARAAGDDRGIAGCLTQIGWFCLQLGHAEQGIDSAKAARDMWARLRKPGGEAHAGAIYAWLLVELSLVDEGFAEASTAVGLAEIVDNPAILAFALNAKAVALMYGRQDQLVGPLLRRSLALVAGTDDLSAQALYATNLAFSQVSLAEAAENEGRLEEGRTWREQALVNNDLAIKVAETCGDKWALRTALCNGAEYYALLGREDVALSYLARWEEVIGTVGLREHVHYLYTRGELLTRMGRLGEALEFCELAVELAEASSHVDHQVNTLRRLSDVHEALGNHAEALQLYKRFHTAYQRQMGEVIRRRAQLLEMQLETSKLRVRAAALEEQVGQDPLTGLPNRRSFDAAFAQLQGSRFCLAIADLDHFKAINDQYSHVVGDAVLQRVAIILTGLGRQMRAFRLGGEEFALLFPGLELNAAAAVAEAVRGELERADLTDLAPRLKLTASIGVASSAGGPATELMTVADRRLYRAKALGRNRVVSNDLADDISMSA